MRTTTLLAAIVLLAPFCIAQGGEECDESCTNDCSYPTCITSNCGDCANNCGCTTNACRQSCGVRCRPCTNRCRSPCRRRPPQPVPTYDVILNSERDDTDKPQANNDLKNEGGTNVTSIVNLTPIINTENTIHVPISSSSHHSTNVTVIPAPAPIININITGGYTPGETKVITVPAPNPPEPEAERNTHITVENKVPDNQVIQTCPNITTPIINIINNQTHGSETTDLNQEHEQQPCCNITVPIDCYGNIRLIQTCGPQCGQQTPINPTPTYIQNVPYPYPVVQHVPIFKPITIEKPVAVPQYYPIYQNVPVPVRQQVPVPQYIPIYSRVPYPVIQQQPQPTSCLLNVLQGQTSACQQQNQFQQQFNGQISPGSQNQWNQGNMGQTRSNCVVLGQFPWIQCLQNGGVVGQNGVTQTWNQGTSTSYGRNLNCNLVQNVMRCT